MDTIETERLKLIPTEMEHCAFLLELLNSPKWIANIGDRKVYDLDQAKAYVENVKNNGNETLDFGQRCIERKSDKKIVGVTGIYQREGLDHADIGFALLPEFEGNGYAFEASKALLDKIIANAQIEEIQAITLPSNKASIKLIEKLGLSYVKKVYIPNDTEELNLYNIRIA